MDVCWAKPEMAEERAWAAGAETSWLGKSRQLRDVGGQVTWQQGRGYTQWGQRGSDR